MKVVAVVPAFNESVTITAVVAGLRAQVSEVVVVDDGSRDMTGVLAKRAGAVVVRHVINRGQGAAEQTGTVLALARGADVVVHFDADGQHDPKDLSAMIAPLLKGAADVTLGSRFMGKAQDIPPGRWLILKLGLLFIRVFSGLRLTDPQNGFRAMTRRAAEQIRITQDGMAHASEIIDQIAEQNLRYVEVPVTIHYTPYSLSRGQSGGNALRIVARLLTDKFF